MGAIKSHQACHYAIFFFSSLFFPFKETSPGVLVVKEVGTDFIAVTWGLLPSSTTTYVVRISTVPPMDMVVRNENPYHKFPGLSSGERYTIEIIYYYQPADESIQTFINQRTSKTTR